MSALQNDLQYRDHLATLITLMLIGSAVARLSAVERGRGVSTQGEERKIPQISNLTLSHRMPLLIKDRAVRSGS